MRNVFDDNAYILQDILGQYTMQGACSAKWYGSKEHRRTCHTVYCYIVLLDIMLRFPTK